MKLLKSIFIVTILMFIAARTSQAEIPNFDRAVSLETKGETTANASLGDIDRDGDLDIILAKGRHWQLDELILINDGKGGFDKRYDLGGKVDRTYTAALVDLNGDGNLDIAVAN